MKKEKHTLLSDMIDMIRESYFDWRVKRKTLKNIRRLDKSIRDSLYHIFHKPTDWDKRYKTYTHLLVYFIKNQRKILRFFYQHDLYPESTYMQEFHKKFEREEQRSKKNPKEEHGPASENARDWKDSTDFMNDAFSRHYFTNICSNMEYEEMWQKILYYEFVDNTKYTFSNPLKSIRKHDCFRLGKLEEVLDMLAYWLLKVRENPPKEGNPIKLLEQQLTTV